MRELTFIVIGGGLLLFVLSWGHLFYSQAQRRTKWQALAAQHALTFTSAGLDNPTVSGTYRGHALTARADGLEFMQRTDNVRTPVTVNLNAPPGLTLALSKKSLTRQLGALIAPAAPTGDDWIDGQFDMSGQPADRVAALLRQPALRPQLEKLYDFEVLIKDQTLTYVQRETVDDPQALLDAAVDFAEAVEATYTRAA